jgi:hypothetical protein
MKKSKHQKNKDYLNFIINEEVLKSVATVQKLVKNFTKQSKSELKDNMKQINEINNKLSTINDIKNSLEKGNSSKYLEIVSAEFESFDNFIEVVSKELPKDITRIVPETGPSHLVIENSHPIYKNQNKIYNFVHNDINRLVQETEFLWRNLRIEEKMTEENRPIIIEKFLKSLEELKTLNHDLFSIFKNLLSKSSSYKDAIHHIIHQYSGNSYLIFNGALTSKDPIILSKLNYCINLVLKNYREAIIGEKFDPLKGSVLYRNILLDKNLMALYKENSIIYFTNFTSTSLNQIFIKDSTNDSYRVEFRIRLLDLPSQEANKFYSGLYIDNMSMCKGEKEVLLTPYQFFLIEKIKFIPSSSIGHYEIYLREIPEKLIINEIEKPIVKSKSSVVVNKDLLKNKLDKILEDSKSKLKEKKIIKTSILETLKDKVEKVFSQSKVDLTSEKEKINQVLHHNIFEVSIKEQTIDLNIEKESIISLNSVVIEDPVQKEEQHKIIKECKSFMEIVEKLTDKKVTIESECVKEIIVSNIIDSIPQTNQKQSEEKLEKINSNLSSKMNANYFKNLAVIKNTPFSDLEFLSALLQKGFSTVSQKTILLDSVHEGLFQFYLQRMTIGNLNNTYYKIFITKKTSLTTYKEITEEIQQNLNQNLCYNNGNYVKIGLISQGGKVALVIETNIALNEIYKYIKECFSDKIQLHEYSVENKYENLVFTQKMLAEGGNMDYTTQYYAPEKRGSLEYNFPNGCKRIGLRVLGQYDNGNDTWLNMNNIPGEFPCAYTCIKDIEFDPKLGGCKNINSVTNVAYPTISKNGIQCSKSIDHLQKFIDPIDLYGQKFLIAFQCRVNPKEVQFASENNNVFNLDRSKNDLIRPYGIIIKKI